MQWNKLDGDGWSQLMASLTGSTIRWHSLKVNQDIIISCGEFPNVPLIGPRACISYNPILSMRQLGRIIRDKPEDSSLKSIILEDIGADNSATLRHIIRAWGKVRTVNKLKCKGGIDVETYSQWVAKRVQEVKIPFAPKDPVIPPLPEPAPVSLEEVEELRKTIANFEMSKAKLVDSLLRVVQERNNLEQEVNEKDETIENLQKKLGAMEERKLQVKDALLGANSELTHRNEQIKALRKENKDLAKYWGESSAEVARLEEKIETNSFVPQFLTSKSFFNFPERRGILVISI